MRASAMVTRSLLEKSGQKDMPRSPARLGSSGMGASGSGYGGQSSYGTSSPSKRKSPLKGDEEEQMVACFKQQIAL
jgi:hypothetical protein